MFLDQIDDVLAPNVDMSFWELSSFNLSDRSMVKAQKRIIKKLDSYQDRYM